MSDFQLFDQSDYIKPPLLPSYRSTSLPPIVQQHHSDMSSFVDDSEEDFGIGMGLNSVGFNYTSTSASNSPALHSYDVDIIKGPIRSLFHSSVSNSLSTLPNSLKTNLVERPLSPLIMKRPVDSALLSSSYYNYDSATVSPQEAFMDYEDVDSKLHDGTQRTDSLFAPLPFCHYRARAPRPAVVPVVAVEGAGSVDKRGAGVGGEKKISPLARPIHPFAVPLNAVSWEESEESVEEESSEDGRSGGPGGPRGYSRDSSETEEIVTPPPYLQLPSPPEHASNKPETYHMKQKKKEEAEEREKRRFERQEEGSAMVYDSSRFPTQPLYHSLAPLSSLEMSSRGKGKKQKKDNKSATSVNSTARSTFAIAPKFRSEPLFEYHPAPTSFVYSGTSSSSDEDPPQQVNSHTTYDDQSHPIVYASTSNPILKQKRPRPSANHNDTDSDYDSHSPTTTTTSRPVTKKQRRRKTPSTASTLPPISTNPSTALTAAIRCQFVLSSSTICNVPFKRPYDLARHEETIHGVFTNAKKSKAGKLPQGKVVWVCESCKGSSFSRRDALLRHQRLRNH